MSSRAWGNGWWGVSAMDNRITRRLFLKTSPAALAVGGTVAAPSIAEALAAAEFTAIPTATYDAIMRWLTAHRANVAAANAYTSSIFARPINPAVTGQLYTDMFHSEREVGPAREAMIAALLDLKGGDA